MWIKGEQMKVLISGSRSIKVFDLSEYIPSNTELIICGGAEGIDTIAERYADQHRLSKLVLRPQYKLYGRAAPIKRNEEMVDMVRFQHAYNASARNITVVDEMLDKIINGMGIVGR